MIQSGWVGRQNGRKLWSRDTRGLYLQNWNTDFFSVFFLRYLEYRLRYRYFEIPRYSVSVTDPGLLRMELKRGIFISLSRLSQAIEPVGGYTTESVTHAWPVRRQTYGYLPSHGGYQFINLCWDRNCVISSEWEGLRTYRWSTKTRITDSAMTSKVKRSRSQDQVVRLTVVALLAHESRTKKYQKHQNC